MTFTFKFILLAVLALYMLMIFLVNGSEFVAIGIVKDPETIASYHFGSEAMVGNGGHKYESAHKYSLVSFVSAFLSAALFLIATYFIRIKNKRMLRIGILILLSSIVVLGFSAHTA